MLVCPECRHGNHEGAETCENCGRSLQPESARMGPPRREAGDLTDLEIKPPTPPSRVPVVVTLGLLALLGAGVGLFLTFQPDPCEGKFSSDRFGYCVALPSGWQAEPASVGTVPVDQFALPDEATTVFVMAVDLPEDTDLDEYAASVRARDQDNGLSPGPVRTTTLGGVAALEWDIAVTSRSGEEFLVRQVVTVRDEVGWTVTLSDSADGFEEHIPDFQDMLASWRFR